MQERTGSPKEFAFHIDMHNMHIFMGVVSLSILAIHLGYLFLMRSAGAGILAEFNFINCAVYCLCAFLFFSKKFLLFAYMLFFTEIFAFSTLMTWTTVNFSGFSIILSPLIPLAGLLGYIYKTRFKKKNFMFYCFIALLSLIFAVNTIKSCLLPQFGIITLKSFYEKTICIYGCIIESVCMAIISMVFCSVAEANNETQNSRIEQLSLRLFITLGQTVEAKDLYTKGHSMRVAAYSEMIAKAMGMSRQDQENIYFCGLLHDIGKISIADTIINKNGKLSEDEYYEIKKHPVAGWNILQSINDFPELAQVARWHHERYDGNGYPDGKKGKDTPLFVRIVSLADAYDAMTSNRSYRKVMPREKVLSIIESEKGKQFDPEIADAFLTILEKDTNYDMREKDSLFDKIDNETQIQ